MLDLYTIAPYNLANAKMSKKDGLTIDNFVVDSDNLDTCKDIMYADTCAFKQEMTMVKLTLTFIMH